MSSSTGVTSADTAREPIARRPALQNTATPLDMA